MKIFSIILFLLFPDVLFSQTDSKQDAAIFYLQQNDTRLNTVSPPQGFTVYYNCDSLLFMKGIFKDTIKIWTSSGDWYVDLEQFKKIRTSEMFGVTQFVKDIDDDGRLLVSTYHQTKFIFHNDSLFEIENSNPTPLEPVEKLFGLFFQKKISEETFSNRIDSLHKIEEAQAIYKPKLIFANKLFKKKGTKVKLSKKLNFQQDIIELEDSWQKNGKNCYVVRINNKLESGEKTSYAFAFNEDFHFIFWEDCKAN